MDNTKFMNGIAPGSNTKNNAIQRKVIKFKKYDDLYVLDKNYVQDDSYMNALINDTKLNLMNLYLKDLPVITVSESSIIDTVWEDFLKDDGTQFIDKSSNKIVDLISKIKSNTNGRLDITLKIELLNSELLNEVAYLSISMIDDHRSDVLLVRFTPTYKFAMVNLLVIDESAGTNNNVFSVTQGAPIYISSKERFIDQHINTAASSIMHMDVIDTLGSIGLLYQTLYLYCDMSEDGKKGLPQEPFNHKPFEISLYNRVYQSLPSKNHALNIMAWQSTSSKTDGHTIALKFRRKGVPNIVYNPAMDSPLIDFSKKEIKFMRNYLDKTTIFKDEKDAEIKINMVEVLRNPRYGEEMMMELAEDDGSSLILHFTYEYDESVDAMCLILSININDDISVFVSFYFEDILHFRFARSLARFESMLIYTNKVSLPQNVDDVTSIIPNFILKQNMLLSIAADIISIYCILYERPQRSKVIKEITRVVDEYSKTVAVIKKPGKRDRIYNKPVKTETFIVRRVLKGAKEAKEYIARMATEGKPNREYTLEEWDRKGHYRRKPNSDELIWIEPTKCHRHLELSDKEIHIKL